ncbi:class I fructose-bisphosphate aldolase [Nocardioides bigeumensis]|uniref:fructose-bisphosphate aldolase n=1 Tax=Nocardioides bigeumensis TaxID=433657 RepID=A0ABN2Y8J2_9ACTN
MDIEAMVTNARALVAPGKGVLAADESTPTMAKRLAAIDVESTEPVRRDYREMLFTTDGLDEHIGGVILFDETVRQYPRPSTANESGGGEQDGRHVEVGEPEGCP